jgi:hypothetical protein
MKVRPVIARVATLALTTKLAALGLAAVAGVLGTALILLAWVAVVAGAGVGGPGCTASLGSGVPQHLAPIFSAASERYELGARGPAILAALTKIESAVGQSMGPSSAGAIGWTQFLPSTWRTYGVDADDDGSRDPYDPDDAIHSSANYLRASGAPQNWRRALFAYNHSQAYVTDVLGLADELSRDGETTGCDGSLALVGDAVRIDGGGSIVSIPGLPGESVDARILGDVLYLIRTYRVTVTDGYAPSGHEADGEHPLGLAVDLVPGPGGTWDDVDRLARWAEPRQRRPRPPFRWVGYDGDPDHGRGHHLHLSWTHGPAQDRRPPSSWVLTLGLGSDVSAPPRPRRA